jgi:hypothetical protein
VIVFIPSACKFDYDLVLRNSSGEEVTHQDKPSKAGVSVATDHLARGTLINYAIHMSKLHAFKTKTNVYQLLGKNRMQR